MQDPQFLSVKPEDIPAQLKALPGWVTWRAEAREPKSDEDRPHYAKIPKNPLTGRNAKPTDPTTGGTFDRAYQAMLANHAPGIGFILTPDDGVVVIDLDDAIQDGVIVPSAQQILERFDTYAEVSPSGTGLHLILTCSQFPEGRCRRHGTEVYWQDRYITVTGHTWPGYDVIKDRTQEFLAWHAEFSAEVGKKPSPQAKKAPTSASRSVSHTLPEDLEVIAACRRMSPLKMAALYDRGDRSKYDNDKSRADQALISLFAKAGVTDPDQFDRLLRGSALRRDKWEEREGYRTDTIATALNSVIPHVSTLSTEEQLRRKVAELEQRVTNAERVNDQNGEMRRRIARIRQNHKLQNTRGIVEVLAWKFQSCEDLGMIPPYRLSLTEVAKAAGVSHQTASRHIKKLETAKLLTRMTKTEPGYTDQETGEIVPPKTVTYLAPIGSARDFAEAAAVCDLKVNHGGKRPGAFGRPLPEASDLASADAGDTLSVAPPSAQAAGAPPSRIVSFRIMKGPIPPGVRCYQLPTARTA